MTYDIVEKFFTKYQKKLKEIANEFFTKFSQELKKLEKKEHNFFLVL